MHANDISCGSALRGGNSDAEFAQYGANIGDAMDGTPSGLDYEADCTSRRSTQRAFVIPLALVGAVAGGFLLLTANRREDDEVSSGPSTTASP